jgi:hypothetical protein
MDLDVNNIKKDICSIPPKTRLFSSYVVHLKGFSPHKRTKRGYIRTNQKKNSSLRWALIRYANTKNEQKRIHKR